MNRRTFIRGLVRVAPIVVVPGATLEALGRSMVGWTRGVEGPTPPLGLYDLAMGGEPLWGITTTTYPRWQIGETREVFGKDDLTTFALLIQRTY